MTTPTDSSAGLRVAIVGCGPIGFLHAQAVAGSPHAELTAVCEPDARRRDETAHEFDVPGFETVEQLLAAEHPDVVTIATPDHLHVEPALAAIAAGCHVFCEKPLAADATAAEQIVKAARQANVQLGVDYNRRFAFGYRIAKRLLDEGTIGTLVRCRIEVSDRTPPAAVARHPCVIFTTLLTHHFDLLRFYGGPIRALSAQAGHGPIEPLLRAVGLSCQLAGGAEGTIAADYRDDLDRTRECMELVGTEGTILVDDAVGRVAVKDPDGRLIQSLLPDRARGEDVFYQSLIAHVQAFVECLARGAAPPVTGDDGLAGLRLAAAAEDSLRWGQTIEVHP